MNCQSLPPATLPQASGYAWAAVERDPTSLEARLCLLRVKAPGWRDLCATRLQPTYRSYRATVDAALRSGRLTVTTSSLLVAYALRALACPLLIC